MNKKRLGIFLGSIALLIVCSFAAYQYWLAPTRILIINATLAQAADIALNNDCAAKDWEDTEWSRANSFLSSIKS